MKNKKILFIIEELGDIRTSGAIVNYNLCKLIAQRYSGADILTLDSISERIKKDWNKYGNLFTHPKENIKSYQKVLIYFGKVKAVIYTLLGNDFYHFNRIKNIKKFLKANVNNYNELILMSGGLGFTPHQAIKCLKRKNIQKITSLYHDPYPISAYPEPYNSVKRWKEYFKYSNLQKSLDYSHNIVFPSQRLYTWYLNDYKIDKHKVRIIPHAVEQVTENNFFKQKSDKICITHTGTLLKPRNPKLFLEIFSELNVNNISVNFYGSINSNVYSDIKKFKNAKNIKIVKERIPYQKSLNILENSDYLLLIESNGNENPFLPTKFVDYINSGKPIIILSPKKSEVSRLVGENYPFLTEQDNKLEIRNILSNKINNISEINKAKDVLKKLKAYFSSDSILESYKSILK
ncbi:hypothetical protein [uncultured Polaribacter sp.]|uniref:hypothetical protein n=1 Tax=uncultured Polaribacter sp. TaxID=174711 RepID=UPI00260F7CF0|nr:hypothetical protein [uncultured Polaribacter sp.]